MIFVPSEVEAVIRKHFKKNRDIYYYIIHSLISSAVHNRDIEIGDYIPSNVSKIKKIINRNPAYYIKNLKLYGILKCDNKYKKGKKAHHYKLNSKYHIDCNKIEISPNSVLYDAIYKRSRNRKGNLNKLPEHLQLMAKKFYDTDLNYKDAGKWIETITEPKKRLIYSMAVEQIKDHRTRYFKRNRRNYRLDTNLTNLKKELRNCLKGDFISIDLANSQPFFMAFILQILSQNFSNQSYINNKPNNQHSNSNTQHYSTLMFEKVVGWVLQNFGTQSVEKIQNVVKNGISGQIRHFEMFQAAKNGIFYRDFQKELNNNIGLDEVKKIMFGVLYSRNVYHKDYQCFIPYKKEKEKFASIYPLEYKIIKILKEKNHSDLAVFMQKLESYIFIDCIAKELVNNGIIPLTIHDSVIIERKHYKPALSIIEQIFREKIGDVPSFHIDKLNTNYAEQKAN